MSKVLKQSKAVLVIAFMYRDLEIYNFALKDAIENFNSIKIVSEEYLFSI